MRYDRLGDASSACGRADGGRWDRANPDAIVLLLQEADQKGRQGLTSHELMEIQRELCRRFGAEFAPVLESQIAGVARGLACAKDPINGLRHPPQGQTCGWYVWAGELSQRADFFEPQHVAHLNEWCPRIMRYLALPPGWRFLIASNYEDVWFDATLLDV